MIVLGELSLWIALLMAVWGSALSFAGGALRRDEFIASGARGLYAASAFLVLAVAGAWTALLTSDFSLRTVVAFSSANLPAPYKLSALWAGRAGTLLLWSLLLSASTAVALWTNRRRTSELMGWGAGFLGAALVLSLIATTLGANPYARVDFAAAEGRGLDPELQTPVMLLYRPLLLLGYATAVLPACGIAALGRERVDRAALLGVLHGWSLVSWAFLATSIVLHLRWAYAERGTVPSAISLLRPWGGSAITALLAIALAVAAYAADARLERERAMVAAGSGARAGSRGRRLGLAITCAGGILLLAAFVGAKLGAVHEVALAEGERFGTKDLWGREWTFTSQGVSTFQHLNRVVTAVTLQARRDGVRRGFIAAEEWRFVDSDDREQFPPYRRAGISSTLVEDVSVVSVGASDGKARLRLSFRPLVICTWIGGVMLVVGWVVALWPRAGPRREETV